MPSAIRKKLKLKEFTGVKSLQVYLSEQVNKGKSIGFVPTMGALHQGHMSLIKSAKESCDIVVCSIFVNPTQFNNPSDLEKYPRTIDADLQLLTDNLCDVVFFPSVEEVYPKGLVTPHVDIAEMEKVMEGSFRPGHFAGVVQVVYRLFDIVQPNKAFFGLKDFQQVAVIRTMQKQLNLPVEIVACETLREPSGLAMSSRNMRLTEVQKIEALHIYKTLILVRNLARTIPVQEVRDLALRFLESNLRLEYLSISNAETLEELESEWSEKVVCCIACYAGEVRLIDNMEI